MREIERRGGRAIEVQHGRRWELLLDNGSGEASRVRVVSRRRGDWQSSIKEGDGQGAAWRFWVFVDLAHEPRFWMLPEPEVVAGIRDRHREYLARHGGRRSVNDYSLHCAIRTSDVAHGADRWDLLGLSCT
ncbi:hypothetical protein [Pseudonocardia yuanmonensis]